MSKKSNPESSAVSISDPVTISTALSIISNALAAIAVSSAPTEPINELAIPPSSLSKGPQPSALRIKQASEYSGLTVWCLRSLAWNRKIPFAMSGKAYLFLCSDLDAYLLSQRYKIGGPKFQHKKKP